MIVPVYNEATLLGNCLEAIDRAAQDSRLDGEPVEVVVVLDACTDRSAAVAVRHHAQIVSLEAHCVGAARAVPGCGDCVGVARAAPSCGDCVGVARLAVPDCPVPVRAAGGRGGSVPCGVEVGLRA